MACRLQLRSPYKAIIELQGQLSLFEIEAILSKRFRITATLFVILSISYSAMAQVEPGLPSLDGKPLSSYPKRLKVKGGDVLNIYWGDVRSLVEI